MEGIKPSVQLPGFSQLPFPIKLKRIGLDLTMNVSGEFNEPIEVLDIVYGLFPLAGAASVTSKLFSQPYGGGQTRAMAARLRSKPGCSSASFHCRVRSIVPGIESSITHVLLTAPIFTESLPSLLRIFETTLIE